MNKRTDSGNGGDDFAEFQFVQDGRFTGGIQSNHQYTHFFLTEQPLE